MSAPNLQVGQTVRIGGREFKVAEAPDEKGFLRVSPDPNATRHGADKTAATVSGRFHYAELD